MEGFTIVDGAVAVVIVLSAILAYSRGLVREVFAILGWVAAAVVAFLFAPQAAPLVKQVPVLSDYLGDNCELSMIAAFFAVFAVTLIVVSIFTPLFSSAVQRSALGGLDQGLGFLFGVARGVLLVAIAFLVYNRVAGGEGVAAVDDSRSAKVFSKLEGSLSAQIPTDVPGWIVQRYNELMGSCGPGFTLGGQTGTAPAGTDAGGAKTVTPPAAPAAPAPAPGN
ncbi:MAG: CvpA family protein [Pseudomonadota bacterium]